MSKLEKRSLKFSSFDEMFSEIDRLAGEGYVSRGNWNLAQTCTHIGNWMRYPVDGFPRPPIFLRPVFWLMKITIGQSMKRKILAEGFKPGVPTAPQSVPEADAASDQVAIDELRSTVDRIVNYSGSLHPSPLFGPMDMDTLKTVTLLHAEHHLGFLWPVE